MQQDHLLTDLSALLVRLEYYNMHLAKLFKQNILLNINFLCYCNYGNCSSKAKHAYLICR